MPRRAWMYFTAAPRRGLNRRAGGYVTASGTDRGSSITSRIMLLSNTERSKKKKKKNAGKTAPADIRNYFISIVFAAFRSAARTGNAGKEKVVEFAEQRAGISVVTRGPARSQIGHARSAQHGPLGGSEGGTRYLICIGLGKQEMCRGAFLRVVQQQQLPFVRRDVSRRGGGRGAAGLSLGAGATGAPPALLLKRQLSQRREASCSAGWKGGIGSRFSVNSV